MTPADDPDLSSLAAVVVLYDSGDVVTECLRSVPAEVEVVVVDNASRDGGAARARAARREAKVIVSEVNRGFGGGCNLGWRATDRPVVAFLNPDLRLEPDTLPVLLERLAQTPHAIVGPALVDADGRPWPCKARPSAIKEALGLLPAAERWAPAGWDNHLPPDAPVSMRGGRVAAVEGACFLLRRSDLEAIGGFDEAFFLYSEEEDLDLRLGRLGGQSVYEPRARAVHIGGTSTARAATLATRHRYRSRIMFYRRRDGELRGVVAALAAALAAAISLLLSLTRAARRDRSAVSPAHWLAVLRGLAMGVLAPLHTGDPL